LILEIDAGNSSIKWRTMANGQVTQRGIVDHQEQSWETMAESVATLERVRIANVAGPVLAASLQTWAENKYGVDAEFAVSRAQLGPVTNGYAKPQTLGVDRWLALVAGWHLVQAPCLVVDAGSALTVDFVGAGGAHRGGYIVPGLFMMYEALYAGTSAVKIKQTTVSRTGPGQNTADAVQTGCMEMLRALVTGARDQLVATEGSAKLVFTGGWVKRLADNFDQDACVVVPELVLDGLALALP
jgi:type III pantothenate kinase